MDEATIDHLISQLWEGDDGDTFALLDSARDEDIFALLRRSRLDHLSLFIGTLVPELAMASPYVVHLGSRSWATREILKNGWGESWGLFFRSHFILQDLRRHFRRLLQVEDDTGKRLFFRFYDPRVLRAFLPTCREDELETVFGPVERFMMESSTGQELLVFSNSGRGLVTRSLPLPTDENQRDAGGALSHDGEYLSN
jgi:hypothetical protein